MNNSRACTPTELEALELTERAGGVRLTVHVRPRSSRSAILGVRERALEVALTSPPVDGQANAELLKLIAGVLQVRRADIEIVVGSSGRGKVLDVRGISSDWVRRCLGKGKK
jgi:uncharacterized protein (TIGR00251 family)